MARHSVVTLRELSSTVSKLLTEVLSLSAECEDLESRSTHNDICIFGIPEDSEGHQPTEFVACLLQDLFSLAYYCALSLQVNVSLY